LLSTANSYLTLTELWYQPGRSGTLPEFPTPAQQSRFQRLRIGRDCSADGRRWAEV